MHYYDNYRNEMFQKVCVFKNSRFRFFFTLFLSLFQLGKIVSVAKNICCRYRFVFALCHMIGNEAISSS
jgi:hypothetical protein